jgi:separase
MTIDVQEAIRCYHEAATQKKHEHIILVLDKALHMFPWESLPCLRGKSVSRLPSLSSLVERVINSPIEGATWPKIDLKKGFYVLNPEGDLTQTQSQFENSLSKYASSLSRLISGLKDGQA